MNTKQKAATLRGMDPASAISFTWGLSEATFFFIVPDVWLTWLALSNGKRACRQAVWTLAGALVGGILVYLWGTGNQEQAHVFTALPGIDAHLVAGALADLEAHGGSALLLGPLSGVPYKLFAFYAPHTIGFLPFILLSIPARLIRFLVVTGLAFGISRGLLRRLSIRHQRLCLILCWLAFYVYYFAAMSGSAPS